MRSSEDHIVYFISDLHLTSSRPELCAAFFNLLPEIAKDATDLFILGDFFNFWMGDDIQSPFTNKVRDALAQLADQGINVYFQHGNRDFAVGQKYAEACKMQIIPEIYTLPFAPNIVVLHGDQLCLNDIKYQRYRKIIRHPIILQCLRSLPKNFRHKIARKLRDSSQKSQRKTYNNQKEVTYAVVDHAVENILHNHNSTIMIHGHTHQPDVHQHINGTRWVLSDWETTGDYLKWDAAHGLSRHTFVIDML